MDKLKLFAFLMLLNLAFGSRAESTILFNSNPFLGESYMQYPGGPYYPSLAQVQAGRGVVQNNTYWGYQTVMTPQGPSQVQVFGMAPPGSGPTGNPYGASPGYGQGYPAGYSYGGGYSQSYYSSY